MKSSLARLKRTAERFFGVKMDPEGTLQFKGILPQKNISGYPYEVYAGEDEEGIFYDVNSVDPDFDNLSSATYYPSRKECDLWVYPGIHRPSTLELEEEGKDISMPVSVDTKEGDFSIEDILDMIKSLDEKYGPYIPDEDLKENKMKGKSSSMKESIRGNTKKFLDNVINYLDYFLDDEEGWLNMEQDIMALKRYSRYGFKSSLNDAIKNYVEGGSLDVYHDDVSKTLNALYENTPEEIEKWEKYPDDKKWDRYVNIMALYIPKAFKKKMGRELGENVPSEGMNENTISDSSARKFIKMVENLDSHINENIFNVAKIKGYFLEKKMKEKGIKNRALSESFRKLRALEESIFVEKGLTREERHNRDMEKIFDFAKKLTKAKKDYLVRNGVSQEEVDALEKNTGLNSDALQQKLIDMGLKDSFYEEFKSKMKESRMKESLHKMQEDYGWEVPYDRVDELYEEMLESFGAERLLESITRAMSTDDLADILAYICRMNDFDSDVFHNEEEYSVSDDEKEYSVSVSGIEWDTDGEDVELPEDCEIVVKASDEDEVGDLIADALSDEYGFTVSSFEDYEILNEKKSSKGDSMKESKEKSLSYEGALKKVHSGEWDKKDIKYEEESLKEGLLSFDYDKYEKKGKPSKFPRGISKSPERRDAEEKRIKDSLIYEVGRYLLRGTPGKNRWFGFYPKSTEEGKKELLNHLKADVQTILTVMVPTKNISIDVSEDKVVVTVDYRNLTKTYEVTIKEIYDYDDKYFGHNLFGLKGICEVGQDSDERYLQFSHDWDNKSKDYISWAKYQDFNGIRESMTYEEALNKVYSGEWDASKFTESVVKGAFTSGR